MERGGEGEPHILHDPTPTSGLNHSLLITHDSRIHPVVEVGVPQQDIGVPGAEEGERH